MNRAGKYAKFNCKLLNSESRTFEISGTALTHIRLEGNTTASSYPLPAVHLHISDPRGDCSVLEAVSTTEGQFTVDVPVGAFGISPLTAVFTHNDYFSTSVSTFERVLGPKEVEMVPEMERFAGIRAEMYDPKAWNRPVSGAEVRVRQGYGNNTGPALLNTVTSPAGTAFFPIVPLGIYTISTNLSSISSNIVLNYENTTFTVILPLYPSIIATNQITFMLSWADSRVDFDLRAEFILRPEHICNVSYVNKQCGGTTLTSELENTFLGIEVLTIMQVSASKYAVFVSKNDTEMSFSGAVMRVFAGSKGNLIGTLYAPSTAGSLWYSYCLNGPLGLAGLSVLNTVETLDTNPCGLGEGETWDWKPDPVSIPLKTNAPDLPEKYVFRPVL